MPDTVVGAGDKSTNRSREGLVLRAAAVEGKLNASTPGAEQADGQAGQDAVGEEG